MRERIQQVSQFVHDYLLKTGKGHENEPWGPKYRWEHTLRVAHWAWILAKEEKADVEPNVIAALFHDVSHFIAGDYRQHGEKSAEIAMDFMMEAGIPKDLAEEISYAVKSHVGERNPKTVLAKILQDADALDRFGHFRILLFGKTTDLANLETVKTDIQALLEYFEKVQSGAFGPMWTATGKEKVKEFLTTSKAVYGELLAEIANTMPPEIYI